MDTICRRARVTALVALLATAAFACEEAAPSTQAAKGAAAEKPVAQVDVAKSYATLEQTFLNPIATRDRALADVAERVFEVERDAAQTPAQYLDKLCAAKVAGCDGLASEARYFHVMGATLGALAERARGKDAALADHLVGVQQALGAMLERAPAYGLPTAAEPLLDLFGDPVLVLAPDGLDVLVGPFVARRLTDLPALDAEAPDEALAAFFDAIAQGDTFAAAGLEPPRTEDGKVPRPGNGKLQLAVPAAARVTHLLPLLQLAYAHKLQAIDLVVRSREYGTLSAIDLNLVKASILGSDQSIEITPEQVIWRDTKKDETQAVAWEGLARIGEIVSRAPGQLVLYVEVSSEVTGQQLADAIAAIRARCGGQEICPTLQLALALKRHKP